MGLSLVTAASSDPVLLSEVITGFPGYQQSTANDAEVNRLIASATTWLQEATCQQFIQATWLQTLDDWPSNGIRIDKWPLSSVSSVKYYDVDGTLQTVSSSLYWVDVNSRPPRIIFKDTFTWPNVESNRPSAVEVTYVAGYANAAAVPSIAKQAIRMLARYWYAKNEAATVADVAAVGASQAVGYGEVPFGVFSIANMLNASGYT